MLLDIKALHQVRETGAEGKLRSFAGPGHSSAEDGGVQHQVLLCHAVQALNSIHMCHYECRL